MHRSMANLLIVYQVLSIFLLAYNKYRILLLIGSGFVYQVKGK